MKRSEVNRALKWAEDLLAANNIRLPDYAYRSLDEWKAHADETETIRRVMLGWDITDFGLDDFARTGAVLYTVRNGLLGDASVGVPYCEKYILMKEGQRLPCHYHVYKTEDIINRAGGVIEVFLWNTDAEGRKLDTDVRVFTDGVEKTVRAGEAVLVTTGNSITLTPHTAHVFGPKAGCGDVVTGEVSKVNDDNTDNYFLEEVRRFSGIEEDEAILRPLCNEYGRVL